jgi:nicotinate-nucleotide adenylyltransferase
MRSKIGLFGGTFDPPHLGHIILAAEVLQQLALDKVIWVLTPDSPFKTEQRKVDILHRVEMVKRAIADDAAFEISLMELERPGPHYTADTVALFRKKFPGDELILLLGGDSLAGFPTWYEPDEILRQIDAIGVMLRPGEGLSIEGALDQFPQLKSKIKLIQAPLLQISSSDIRHRILSGNHYRYYLPALVFDYIREFELYQ